MKLINIKKMNKLLKTLITGIIIYAIFMVFIDCLFSFLSVAKQTDLDVLLIDKQIPQLVCMAALIYTIINMWKKK
jgi:hypothetical protein